MWQNQKLFRNGRPLLFCVILNGVISFFAIQAVILKVKVSFVWFAILAELIWCYLDTINSISGIHHKKEQGKFQYGYPQVFNSIGNDKICKKGSDFYSQHSLFLFTHFHCCKCVCMRHGINKLLISQLASVAIAKSMKTPEHGRSWP